MREFHKIVSISQEALFRQCGWRFKLERVDKVPTRETIQMRFGSAFHDTLALFNRGLRSGTWLPFEFLMYQFRKTLGPEFLSDYWEYRARLNLAYYLDDVAPRIGKPLLVEEQFYIDITDRLLFRSNTRYLLTGIIDLLTEDRILHDYKVVTKVRTIQDVMQEACYREGITRMLGDPPRALCRVHILRDADPPEINRDWMEVGEKDIDEFWTRMIGFVGQLRRRVFMKNPESRWCHPRFCPHYGTTCDPEAKTQKANTDPAACSA